MGRGGEGMRGRKELFSKNDLNRLTFNCQLRMSAEVHCEASYYNEKLSVWEPLLEPLEDPKTGRLQAWLLAAEVGVAGLGGDGRRLPCLL